MLAGTAVCLSGVGVFDMGLLWVRVIAPGAAGVPVTADDRHPEVTNAWLSLAHDEFGAHAGPVARRRHPDFLRTVQFVLPGVARARHTQASVVIAAPGRRTQTRVRT
ncbi:hypothetical protein HMPREF9057_00941 [Actinomyces sp. oral taxon 171 str. F0337]|nr:hypothetical protein HMPREF9057_00941 [Actinomyces sp. oral taxon 171 str. F0337]